MIQTYNKTTFQSCSIDDSLDTDTFVYNGGSNELGTAVIIPVSLTIEGTQYYFSDASDGAPCQHGMAFGIKVGHGAGLPPSLNQPPPPPYAPPPEAAGERQSPTVIVGTRSPNGGVRISGGFLWLVLVVLVL